MTSLQNKNRQLSINSLRTFHSIRSVVYILLNYGEGGWATPQKTGLDYLIDLAFGTGKHKNINNAKVSVYFLRYRVIKLAFSRREQVIAFRYLPPKIRFNDTKIIFLRQKNGFIRLK